jgi:hypothetical protein
MRRIITLNRAPRREALFLTLLVGYLTGRLPFSGETNPVDNRGDSNDGDVYSACLIL